jgi:hypothetical protein
MFSKIMFSIKLLKLCLVLLNEPNIFMGAIRRKIKKIYTFRRKKVQNKRSEPRNKIWLII